MLIDNLSPGDIFYLPDHAYLANNCVALLKLKLIKSSQYDFVTCIVLDVDIFSNINGYFSIGQTVSLNKYNDVYLSKQEALDAILIEDILE